MSRSQNLLTIAIVVGLGVISGGYTFRPAIEDLEKEKRGEPLEKPAMPRDGTVKILENPPSDDQKDIREKATTETTEQSLLQVDADVEVKDSSETRNVSKGRVDQRLPSYLQPWDARKR